MTAPRRAAHENVEADLHRLSLHFVVCCVMIIFLHCPARAEIVDKIAAIVNGEIITLYDIDERAKPVLNRLEQSGNLPGDRDKALEDVRDKILDRLVEMILLRQEADKYQIEVADSEVENQIEQFRKKHGLSEEELRMQLQREGMTRDEYAAQLRDEILQHRIINFMVRRKVMITDEEIREYYNQNLSDFSSEKTVSLQLILLPEDVDGKELRQRIVAGDIAFGDAAEKYSVGPGAESGGDIGTLEWKQLAVGWREALSGLQENDISRPFLFNGREALLRVRDLRDGEAKPLSEARDEIVSILHGPKMEKMYEEYMNKLKRQALIKIKL